MSGIYRQITLFEDKLKAFILKHSSPLIMNFDMKSAQLIFGKNQPGLIFIRDLNNTNSAELDKIVTSLAEELKGKLQIVLVNGVTGNFEKKLAEYIGVVESELPTIRLADTKGDLKKYKMEGSVTKENILKFIQDWDNGKLILTLKSEPIPAKNDEDVFVLVGKQFNEIVFDKTKDVLVEFYSPTCGHCKKLVPIYDELAYSLKRNKNLIIAKIDATANEVENMNVKSFPTIKFWPAGDKSKHIDFKGDRTVDGFTKFLKEHSGNKLEEKEDL